jgi:hypothetical protein
MPVLIPEFEYHANLDPPQDVGVGPFGQRLVVPVPGGELVGDRLKGSFVGSAGDWLLAGADGFGRLDVRATLETSDGALIYFQYFGLLELTPGITGVLEGGDTPTNFGDQYFFTNPRLETGDERYAWVNQTFFVGQGRLTPGPSGPRVEYQVYRLANSA